MVADSAYGGQSVLGSLPTNCDLTSRMVIKSRLYAAPPARTATTKGRPRVRGERLPTPQDMLMKRCRHVTLEIYGRRETSRVADQLAHTYAGLVKRADTGPSGTTGRMRFCDAL